MGRLVVGGSIGFFVAAIFNSILVVVKELNESVHDWLVQVFSHHWLGQGIVVILVFVVVTAIVYSVSRTEELSESMSDKLIATVVAGALLSYLIIAGFFLIL